MPITKGLSEFILHADDPDLHAHDMNMIVAIPHIHLYILYINDFPDCLNVAKPRIR